MEWIEYSFKKPLHRSGVLFTVRSDFNRICLSVHKGIFLERYCNENIEAINVFISDSGGFFREECVSHWALVPNPPIV